MMSTPNDADNSVGDDEGEADQEVGDDVDAAEADPTAGSPDGSGAAE